MKAVIKKFERQEYKYLLNLDQYRQVRQYFQDRGLIPDSYSIKLANGKYYVASLYLDTADYAAYWEKMHGYRDRIKYRLRTYVHQPSLSTPIFWEIKRKYGDFFKKDRLFLPWGKTNRFLKNSIGLKELSGASSDQEILTRFYYAVINNRLAPVLLISYYREPWLDPVYPNLRLTFDQQIQANPTQDLFSVARQANVLADQVVLEIKFSGPVPGYLGQLNEFFSLNRQTVSKYCLSLEACGIVREENL